MFGVELADAATIITVVGGVGALVFLLRVVGVEQEAAQIAAKDAIIETWEQNNEANEKRIEALEETVKGLSTELVTAQGELKILRIRYEQLERYAAPEAVQRFEEQQETIIGILRALEGKMA